jgi:hypothetical protein
MKIRRRRRRGVHVLTRAPELTSEEPAETTGARAPGVRVRRLRETRELDWNERLRRRLTGGTGATVWRG